MCYRKPLLTLGLLLFLGSAGWADVYVNFQNGGTTWSNTQLGGGVPQPVGYIVLPDVADDFTGTLGIGDFLSWSDVKYGSQFEFTWSAADLLADSTISFVDGALVDVNLIYWSDGVLLVLSGPPTANWAIVNSPQPPAVDFPGFPSFNGGFARGDLKISVELTPIDVNQKPEVPPIASPKKQDVGIVSSKGFIHLNEGGVAEPADTKEWPTFRFFRGRFSLLAAFEQKIVKKPVVDEQLYFAHVVVNGTAVVGGQHVGLDSDFHLLNGEPYPFSSVHSNAAAVARRICRIVRRRRLGYCCKIVTRKRVFIAVAIFKRAPADRVAALTQAFGELEGFDALPALGELQLSAKFHGTTSHKSLPVPILEAPLEFLGTLAADQQAAATSTGTPDVRVQLGNGLTVNRDGVVAP